VFGQIVRWDVGSNKATHGQLEAIARETKRTANPHWVAAEGP